MLDVPTDKAGAVTRGFEALSDFAGGITLDSTEIDKERGVVLEEWRGRLGASDAHAAAADERAVRRLASTPIALPIGTPESIKSFPQQRLRDFYRDYYRPDRMAVVVVGEIDPQEVEAQIRTHFGALPRAAAGARQRAPDPAASGHALRHRRRTARRRARPSRSITSDRCAT